MLHLLLLVQWLGHLDISLVWSGTGFHFSATMMDILQQWKGERMSSSAKDLRRFSLMQLIWRETNWQCLKGIEIPLHNLKSGFLRLLPSEESRKGNPSLDNY